MKNPVIGKLLKTMRNNRICMIYYNHEPYIKKAVKGAKALLLGITFKENCPDIRNTKAIDIYNELIEYGIEVDVYDPCLSR